MNESDLEILNAYLDRELPMGDCEGLWRRLAVDAELSAELDCLRAAATVRGMVWANFEPADNEVRRLESELVREARRQDMFQTFRRIGSFALTAAACLLFGFTTGWIGHGGPGTPHLPGTGVQAVSTGGRVHAGQYVVNVKDQTGRVIGVQRFNSLQEAQQFADDVSNTQAGRMDDRQPMVVPTEGRF